MSAVLFDAWCGEPIAWCRVGDPVIGSEWSSRGPIAVTRRITAKEATERYGPALQVVVGPGGGFRSATYGEKEFLCPWVDPRPCDPAIVITRDDIVEMYECPRCGRPPGQPCDRPGGGKHQARSQGRTRGEIETAERAVREAQRKAEAEAAWEEELATPPPPGMVLETRRWAGHGFEPVLVTVTRAYPNRVVAGVDGDGCERYLLRHPLREVGTWMIVCGQPTRAGQPCRNPECQVHPEGGERR